MNNAPLVLKNVSLKNYHTFGFDVKADTIYQITDNQQLKTLFKNIDDFVVIGSGSNLLITRDLHIPVIQFKTNSYSIKEFDKDYWLVSAEAGLEWDNFVEICLKNKCYGLENLSLIPGTVGAAAVQNIGAYGVEVCELINEVIVFNRETLSFETIPQQKCGYSYRYSFFKDKWKKKYLIVAVNFKLKKKPDIILTYESLKNRFNNIFQITPEDIRKHVIEIRRSKLPDIKQHGNAGSFFKNPVIEVDVFLKLQKDYPDISYIKLSDNKIKIFAGWLIEKCGLKGFRYKNVGVYDKQALVLVHYGNGTPDEIIELAELIQERVCDKFGIVLEKEVEFL